MLFKKTGLTYCLLLFYLLSTAQKPFDVDQALDDCVSKVKQALPWLKDSSRMPRNILHDQRHWNCTSIYDWTSGFWPGILWYCYEYTNDETLRREAERFSQAQFPVTKMKAYDHDLGFMMFCSLGNGYRLTRNEIYKDAMLHTAGLLATLYNPKVGTILSWPAMIKKMRWPHLSIIDNMMNLELLFWAAKNGGTSKWYDMAFRHAEVTMNNQFRDDHSACHVAVYDTITGKKMKQVTNQGYSDGSMWARGQAWAVYGFTMAYRETHYPAFLRTVQEALAAYLEKLPADGIPYWDFNAPHIPNEPRDASAAAIVASALLELSQLTNKPKQAKTYIKSAIAMLETLSSHKYASREQNDSFLLHSTGNWPAKSEIDASIIYADYYYLEALIRLKHINKAENYK